MANRLFLVITPLLLLVGLPLLVGNLTTREAKGMGKDEKVMGFDGQHAPVWNLRASNPLLIGGYGDNFNYSGSRVKVLDGNAKVSVNSEANSAKMVVNIKGTITPEKGKTYSGDIKIVYTRVMSGGPPFQEGGVADFIYLHGDTKQGAPVMPKTRVFVTAWSFADIYVNGERVYKDLVGHMMYSERVRNPKTLAIYNKNRSGFYSPKKPGDGSIAAPGKRELHFVAHTTKPDKGNFPAHSVWIHLNFQNPTEI